MEMDVPVSLQPLLDAYLHALEPWYAHFYGIYFDYWVMTAITTLCRILTAIEEGEIIAKSSALMRWRDRFPPRWQVLLDEAWRIRHHLSSSSLYRNRIHRIKETRAFIKYVQTRGGKALEELSYEERC